MGIRRCQVFLTSLLTSPTMISPIPNKPHQTSVALDFLVIGGSSAGLSAAYALRRVGHRVLVLEQNADFFDVSYFFFPSALLWVLTFFRVQEHRSGAYRIPPNMSKVFYHWGLEERLLKLAIKSNMTFFNRCKCLHPPPKRGLRVQIRNLAVLVFASC